MDHFKLVDYTPIVNYLGNVLLKHCFGPHKGDMVVVYGNSIDEHIGFLVLGYGSCSYCDDLQQCSNYEDVDRLVISTSHRIQRFANGRQLFTYLNAHGPLKFYWHESEFQIFMEQLRDLLRGKNGIE